MRRALLLISLAFLGLAPAEAQRMLPELDLHPPAHLRTATFSMG